MGWIYPGCRDGSCRNLEERSGYREEEVTLPQVTLEKLRAAEERAVLEKPRRELQAFSLLGKGQEPGTQGRHPNQGQGHGFPSPGHPPLAV